jgi:UDP-N-acetylmuramoyl-tripeptide--D-alanyl-D-alanine ligase
MKRKILQIILGLITKGVILRHKPQIVAVTGSVGKTSTKNAIHLVLSSFFKVRKSVANLNTEFGVPLVFLGREKGGGDSLKSWLEIIFFGIKMIVFKDKRYPEIVVVEMGADKPGDISYLTRIAKPDVSVITFIGDEPPHLENYQNLEKLVFEKAQIVKNLKASGWAVINFDDEKAYQARRRIKNETIGFGFSDQADVQISDFKYSFSRKKINGIAFKIKYRDWQSDFHLPLCLSKASAYSVAAAFSTALCFGINPERIPLIAKNLEPEKNRMNLIKGKNHSQIIDDTYNASPASTRMALETLAALPAQRKIAFLGEMKELGPDSIKFHQEMKETAQQSADIVVLVGDQWPLKKKDIHFKSSLEAVNKIPIKRRDLILVKGSRAVAMEKILKSFVE